MTWKGQDILMSEVLKLPRFTLGVGDRFATEAHAQLHACMQAVSAGAAYATVIAIDYARLPKPDKVAGWTSDEYVSALRHDQANTAYDPGLRQLLHVGFKIAALMGDRYLTALRDHRETVGRNVTANLFDRHIRPIFLGS